MLVLVAVLGGLATWSLAEYVLHRWGFHHHRTDPVTSLVAREHRLHHRAPLRTSPMMRTLAWLGVAVLGSPILLVGGTGSVALLAGWCLGYTAYDQVHWRAHHRAAANRYERWVRARHRQHHFGQPQRNFGVTSAVWDRVFRTTATTSA